MSIKKIFLTIYILAENCLADIVLALVPASVIMNLNMEMKKRVSLTILLGLGLM